MMDVRQYVLWEEAPICSLRNMFIGKQFACDHIDDDASDKDGIDDDGDDLDYEYDEDVRWLWWW